MEGGVEREKEGEDCCYLTPLPLLLLDTTVMSLNCPTSALSFPSLLPSAAVCHPLGWGPNRATLLCRCLPRVTLLGRGVAAATTPGALPGLGLESKTRCRRHRAAAACQPSCRGDGRAPTHLDVARMVLARLNTYRGGRWEWCPRSPGPESVEAGWDSGTPTVLVSRACAGELTA